MTDYYPQVELRRFLITQGVGKWPEDAGSLPPIYVDRDDGPKPPSTAEPVTIHLSDAAGVPSAVLEGWERTSIVQVNIRYLPEAVDPTDDAAVAASRAAQTAAYKARRDIEELVIDGVDYDLGSIRVSWSGEFAAFGRYPDGEPEAGQQLRAQFWFRAPMWELRK